MTMLEHGAAKTAPGYAFVDHCTDSTSFADAVWDGLRGPAKSIPCRFLYDRRGSILFDQICELPEYYITRTETAILKAHARDIADLIGRRASIVELGSGSSTKTRILLNALDTPACYAPIDVSREHLRTTAAALARDYPDLRIEAICADYFAEFPLPKIGRRTAAFFPGSTIGNLTRPEALALLRSWRARLGENGMMVIGMDLKKDVAALEAAYDDCDGVTEDFIKNILMRANKELGATFDPEAFIYEARYVSEAGRVEMHLISAGDQITKIGRRTIALKAGERIHVENSHKYTIEEAQALGREAGFAPTVCYTDSAEQFSVHVWTAA